MKIGLDEPGVTAELLEAALADKIMDADITLERLERFHLERVLQKTRGNKTLAA